MAAPRWREVPDEAARWADWLRTSAGPDPAESQARAAEARVRATDALPDVLRAAGAGSFAGLAAAETRAAQTLLPYRQRARHHWMTGYALIREVILEIARRNGLGEDVFFLHLDEIRRFPVVGDWKRIAGQRQQQWRWLQRLAVPDVVESTNLDAIGNCDQPLTSTASRLDAVALSPGSARGPIYLLAARRPTTDLRPGTILVCPALDTGLAPLMLVAAAIIVERGGILSHGAIVARQIGLPVVALPNATRLLHDGQRVVVDADRGCVLCAAEGNA